MKASDRIQKVAEIIDGEAWWRCPQEPDTCASCLERREIANTKSASIEALYSEEIERLRGALEPFAPMARHYVAWPANAQVMAVGQNALFVKDFRRALQALSGGGGDPGPKATPAAGSVPPAAC